jgi:hypothetical protein
MASRFLQLVCGAVAMAGVILGSSLPASAGVIVDFSGTFVNLAFPSYYARLGGGSFTGSFTLSGELPVGNGATSYFSAFTVNLYDAAHNLEFSFSSSKPGSYGYVSNAYVSFYGGDIVDFFDPNGSYFQLVFPSHFTGNGSLASSGLAGNSYTYLAPGDYGYMASATASIHTTPLPEASTIHNLAVGVLMALALGMGAVRRSARSRLL